MKEKVFDGREGGDGKAAKRYMMRWRAGGSTKAQETERSVAVLPTVIVVGSIPTSSMELVK